VPWWFAFDLAQWPPFSGMQPCIAPGVPVHMMVERFHLHYDHCYCSAEGGRIHPQPDVFTPSARS
jgi:hypothetical protein